MATHLSLGRFGEKLAARYLRDQGMEVLERNWRCGDGELDLIARDGNCLVVCEVKTRAVRSVGDPLEAITWTKVRRLRWLAAAYLRSREESFDTVRIDAIGVLAEPGHVPIVRHVVAVGA